MKSGLDDALLRPQRTTINLKLRSTSKDYILRAFVDSHIARFDRLIREASAPACQPDLCRQPEPALRRCQSVIEAITLCFEIYFVQFSLVTNNQLQYLVESWKFLRAKLDAKYSQPQRRRLPTVADPSIDPELIANPDRLNFFTTKLLRLHKRRLDDELKAKFDQIRHLVARAVENSGSQVTELDLYELVDLKSLLASIEKRLRYFEGVGKQSLEQARRFNEMLFSEPELFEGGTAEGEEAAMVVKYSDFLSDTEALVASKNKSLCKHLALLRVRKWQKELENRCSRSRDSGEDAARNSPTTDQI